MKPLPSLRSLATTATILATATAFLIPAQTAEAGGRDDLDDDDIGFKFDDRDFEFDYDDHNVNDLQNLRHSLCCEIRRLDCLTNNLLRAYCCELRHRACHVPRCSPEAQLHDAIAALEYRVDNLRSEFECAHTCRHRLRARICEVRTAMDSVSRLTRYVCVSCSVEKLIRETKCTLASVERSFCQCYGSGTLDTEPRERLGFYESDHRGNDNNNTAEVIFSVLGAILDAHARHGNSPGIY